MSYPIQIVIIYRAMQEADEADQIVHDESVRILPGANVQILDVSSHFGQIRAPFRMQVRYINVFDT